MRIVGQLRDSVLQFIRDEHLSEIVHGSAWAIIAQMAATVLGLLLSVIVARAYGAEMVGILALVQAFMIFATLATVLGTNTSVLRMIPEHVAKYSLRSANSVYNRVQLIVLVASILVGMILYSSSGFIAQTIFTKPHLSFFLSLSAVFLLFRSLMEVYTQSIRGLKLIKEYSVMRVVPPCIALLALIAMTSLGAGPNSPVYAQVVSWFGSALVGFAILHRYFDRRVKSTDHLHTMSAREILRLSMPMAMTASMHFVVGQTGVILLGVYGDEVEVGHYAIAVKLATLTSFILHAVNMIAAPKFSELHHSGKQTQLVHVARMSTRLIFWSTFPILLILLILGRPVLSILFGSEFVAAYPAMALLIVGQFVNSISGSAGHFLSMTGHQKEFRNAVFLAALINVVLGFVLIPSFGAVGAAFAGLFSLAFWNVYAVLYIKRIFGFSIAYMPLVSGKAR